MSPRPRAMPCDRALSVLLDGPLPGRAGNELAAARQHLRTCPACAAQAWGPDPADAVLQRLGPWRGEDRRVLRSVLCAASVVQLVVALPWLFGANPLAHFAHHADAAHLTRDGALGIAVAAAGAASALRPRFAVAMSIIGGVALALQLAAGVVDSHTARVGGGFEAVHGLAVVVVALVIALARPPAPPIGRSPQGARWAARSLHTAPSGHEQAQIAPGAGLGNAAAPDDRAAARPPLRALP